MISDKKFQKKISRIVGLLSQDNSDFNKKKLLSALSFFDFRTDVVAETCMQLLEIGEMLLVIEILQKSVVSGGENELIYSLMGQTALKLDLPELAEKSYRRASGLNPNEASHLLHLAISLEGLGQYDAAIDLLTSSLERFPLYAKFWNTLGTYIAEYRGDRSTALIFLLEAVRLAPESATILHDLALKMYGDANAKRYYERALELEPENAQIHVSFAIYLLGFKQFFRARKHYEYRLDLNKGTQKEFRYNFKIPHFQRGPLDKRNLLILAEQGIGDEIYFSFPTSVVATRVKQLYLTCDPRLLNLYRRSFPNVKVYPYLDDVSSGTRVRHVKELEWEIEQGLKIDYCIHAGTLFLRCSPDVATYQQYEGGFLVPDQGLVELYRKKLPSTPRPSYGIAWRSANTKGERHKNYLDIQLFIRLSEVVNADFIVLQYSMEDEEKKLLEPIDNIHIVEEIDLKQDIDGNVAIMSLLDAVLTPSTATLMLSLGVGRRTILISPSKPYTVAVDEKGATMCGAKLDYVKYEEIEVTLKKLLDVLPS